MKFDRIGEGVDSDGEEFVNIYLDKQSDSAIHNHGASTFKATALRMSKESLRQMFLYAMKLDSEKRIEGLTITEDDLK